MSARSRVLAAAASVALLLPLSACGSSSTPDQPRDASEKPDLTATPVAEAPAAPSGAKVVEITLEGGTTDPDGAQVAAKVGQPIVLEIAAEEAGQLHVHSTPEHLVAFPAGESRVTLEIDRPGIVDVEDHTLDQLIFQLEVS